MGAHMLPGRERWRALRRSIRFSMIVILAIPIISAVVMWVFAGITISNAIATRSQATTQNGTVLIRIALADVVGLAAVLVAAGAMAWFARRLSRDASSLETSARRFADQQFPQLVERLRRGEEVDAQSELPPVAHTKITELTRAAEALASVQRTALDAAVTETSLRSGISQVFVSLARRSQSLLQRQLRLLDELERKAVDPGALADLFPLDHLTTRMRRHAEGLIILSGAVPGRAWSSPVPVIDVIRGAVAEVEDYKRITVVTTSDDMVTGSAVADMIHLLAELIENATLFSPSGTRVEVKAERVGNGFAFEIEDRGLGIKPEELDTINLRLGSPADFDLANADQLGLFVVGKLAARHGVRVFLRPSPYGGTTAIVLMPSSMITSEGETPSAEQPEDSQVTTASLENLQLALTGRQMRRISPTAHTADTVHGQPGAHPGPADTGSFPRLPGTSPGEPAVNPAEPAASAAAASPATTGPGQPDVSTGLPSRRKPDSHHDLPARKPDSHHDLPARKPDSHHDLPVRKPGSHHGLPVRRKPDASTDHLAGTSPGEPDTSPGEPDTSPGEPDTSTGMPTFFLTQPTLLNRPVFPGQPGSTASPPSSTASPPSSTANQPGPPRRLADSPDAGTYRGLPRRVRQANLSPHLRNSPSPGTATPPHELEARSPEQAKSLLASLQSGWERGRQAEVPDSETTAGGQDAESSTREAPPEET